MARESAARVAFTALSEGDTAVTMLRGPDDLTGGASDVLPDSAQTLVSQQRRAMTAVTCLKDLHWWRDELVDQHRQQRSGFCGVVGSMLAGLTDDTRRARSASFFDQWHLVITGALQRLQASRALDASADAYALATGLLAAVQGGYLLARVCRDPAKMEWALDAALARLDDHALQKSEGCRPGRG